MSGVQRVCTSVVLALVLSVAAVPGLVSEGRCQTSPDVSGPTVTNVTTDPMVPRTGDTVKLMFDLAGDAIRAEVKWTINGEQVQASEYDFRNTRIQLDHPIKMGDVVVASIIAYDVAGNASRTFEKRITAQKSPPNVKLVNEAVGGGMYTAKIEATDPDGGNVSLKLEQAPEGLKMDENGNIQWQLVKDKSGKFPLRVVAEDDRGNKSYFSYEVGIKWTK